MRTSCSVNRDQIKGQKSIYFEVRPSRAKLRFVYVAVERMAQRPNDLQRQHRTLQRKREGRVLQVLRGGLIRGRSVPT